MDKHELIVKLKDLAIELGRTPTAVEFTTRVPKTQFAYRKHFGSYAVLVQAADLDPVKNGYKSIKTVSQVFHKDIITQIQNHEPTEKTPFLDIKFTDTIIFGDLHFPFVHQPKLNKAFEIVAALKPKRIVQVGDLYDMLSNSKFPRSLNVYTPGDELALGRKAAETFWGTIQKLVPRVECHQILGNHDWRPMKQVLAQAPELEMFLDFEKWFKFDGVETNFDIRKELILDGIAYIHGYKSRLGEHMEYMRRPVICGHTHKAGVVYKNYGDTVHFEMNVGYLGDPDSKALSYTPQRHTHWTHSMGRLSEHGPQVILL